MAYVGTKEPLCDGPRRVMLVEGGDQRSQNLPGEFRLRRIVNLIARAVDDNARMIAVAPHSVAQVSLSPLAEIQMIVVWILGDGPCIEQLVHHQETHAVAQIQKFRGWRIMRCANGIHAQSPERFQPSLPRAQRDSRAKSAGIVMKTDALDLEVVPVEPEARRGVEMKLANTERRRLI